MNLSSKTNLSDIAGSVRIPEIRRSISEVGRVVRAERAGDGATVAIELGLPISRLHQQITESVRKAVADSGCQGQIDVSISTAIREHGVQPNLKPMPGVKNIIAVASGKGGVGKSTTAVNIALALADDGARVGVLDADIYGPSQPQMLGVSEERPVSADGKTMDPLSAHGLQVMSIGFLVDQDQPMVWRGPMVTSALNQLLKQTNWEDLDYLIVDMPPGTGDIQLTLSQQVPVSGAVIVTTPQDIALLDARKGLQMFRKVSVPVLGIVENMSTHVCSKCGHEEAIFGSGGGARMAADYDIEVLGELPLDRSIREQTDSGRPTVVSAPDSPQAEAYRHVARHMSARLAIEGRDYSRLFPNIVVEKS